LSYSISTVAVGAESTSRRSKPDAFGRLRRQSVALPAFVDELAATCGGKDRDDLIRPASDGGYLAPPTNTLSIARAVERRQRSGKAFARTITHDLRHTAASLAVSAAAKVTFIQRIGGCAAVRRAPQRVRRSLRLWPHRSGRRVV
jgi:hypothetical protein